MEKEKENPSLNTKYTSTRETGPKIQNAFNKTLACRVYSDQ